MSVLLEDVFQRQTHIWKKLEDGVIALKNPKTMRAYYLNKVMGEIWLLLDGTKSLGAIFNLLNKVEGNEVYALNDDFKKAIEVLVKSDIVGKAEASLWL